MSVRIYVEGGFEGNTSNNCRAAFRKFFEKLVRPGSFSVIASGSRANAFRNFSLALRQHKGDYILLLVDSETAVTASPWQHLGERETDGWHRPVGASEDQAHLMVQVMEAWFLADHQLLADFYGQGFLRRALPRQSDIEQIAKADVLRALRRASKSTSKGGYHKTRHGFELLEQIDPRRVRAASRHAERLFGVLESKTAV